LHRSLVDTTVALNFSGPHAERGALIFAGDVFGFDIFFFLAVC
jgi:hypothetical protein